MPPHMQGCACACLPHVPYTDTLTTRSLVSPPHARPMHARTSSTAPRPTTGAWPTHVHPWATTPRCIVCTCSNHPASSANSSAHVGIRGAQYVQLSLRYSGFGTHVQRGQGARALARRPHSTVTHPDVPNLPVITGTTCRDRHVPSGTQRLGRASVLLLNAEPMQQWVLSHRQPNPSNARRSITHSYVPPAPKSLH